MKKNFPDSDVAKAYQSARTKTACILNYAVAPELKRTLVSAMQLQPYSLSTDASSDTGLSKMNPLTVRIYDINRNVITQQFLDLCLTTGEDAGKAKSIFDKIDDTLKELNIPWDHCTSFGVDNTNTNIGARNSLKTRVLEKNPAVYFVGCPCHIIHNAAQKAGNEFCKATGFDVESCCIDHYYWFDKSTRRKGGMEKYSEFCDTEYRGFIKHVNVRWLSLQMAVERMLKLYPLSRAYFLSEGLNDARFLRLQQMYEDPMYELNLLFYQAALPAFTTFNLYLQRDAPQIYSLHGQMYILLRKLLSKFILARVIRDSVELTEIDYTDRANQVDDSQLFIGLITRSEIQKKLDGGDISPRNVAKFFAAVRSFYSASVAYILKWLPWKEPVVKDSKFVDFFMKNECDFSMVTTYVQRYPALVAADNEQLDKLNEEFVDYQTLSKEDIPESVWNEASEVVDAQGVVLFWRMDIIWGHLAQMKLPGTGILRFPQLANVAQVVLTIPHSNAGEERVFSIIRKIKRDDRGMLQLEGTLSSLIMVKMNLPGPCFKYEPSKQVLKDAKQATYLYNTKQLATK